MFGNNQQMSPDEDWLNEQFNNLNTKEKEEANRPF